jgi:hypothetical protein
MNANNFQICTFIYSCSTEYSEERPFTSLVYHRLPISLNTHLVLPLHSFEPSDIVTASNSATVYRQFSEATVPVEECGPCPVFASSYTPAFDLQLRKNHGRTSVGVAEKRLTEDCWARFVWWTWWPFHGRPRRACWPSPPLACASGDLGRPSVRYLPSCRTKGFPAPTNVESKLSVRDLMWSAKNGTPKFS